MPFSYALITNKTNKLLEHLQWLAPLKGSQFYHINKKIIYNVSLLPINFGILFFKSTPMIENPRCQLY